MINLILFGKPGTGKGTQAVFLQKKYSLLHISTGELFRNNIKNKTVLGTSAKSYLDKGLLVPDEITINMLKDAVNNNLKSKGFIFDGFPRTILQAKKLDDLLSEKDMKITATIAFEAPDEVLIKRLLNRGKISNRSDDQDEEKIKIRIDEYNNKTKVLKDFYTEQNKLYGLNAVGTIEEIKEKLIQTIDSLLKK